MRVKHLSELTKDDLNKQVEVFIGFQQKESGTLTDFFGSLTIDDEVEIAVELNNDVIYFLDENAKISIDESEN